MFAYPPWATKPDPRYRGVARDGVWLHLQSYKPQRAGMTDAFLWVADVDRLHDELLARGAELLARQCSCHRPIKRGERVRPVFAIQTGTCSFLPQSDQTQMRPNASLQASSDATAPLCS